MAAYRNDDIRRNCVTRTYSVPKATLKTLIDGTNRNAFGHKQLFGRTTDQPGEVENDLVNHMLLLEERLFGLTRTDSGA